MEYVVGIWAFLGFLAFLQVSSLATKQKRMERRESEGTNMKSNVAVMLMPYVGQEVAFVFYEDEEDLDMVYSLKNKVVLLDVDEKWALVKVDNKKKNTTKLIRISSIKGVSF